jgi:hypothetical protein
VGKQVLIGLGSEGQDNQGARLKMKGKLVEVTMRVGRPGMLDR